MWILELVFTGQPERLAARPAHRARLDALHRQGVVCMAGPFADDTGAIIIIDAPSREAVTDIVNVDPYFTSPGVTIARILEWRPFLPAPSRS
ncbi:MAG TPA: YciI family protein [Jiangellales bacterium]|nr:YciI family protein [Jiangellales bacterium]